MEDTCKNKVSPVAMVASGEKLPTHPKKGSTHKLASDLNLLLLHPPISLRMELFLESGNLEVELLPLLVLPTPQPQPRKLFLGAVFV